VAALGATAALAARNRGTHTLTVPRAPMARLLNRLTSDPDVQKTLDLTSDQIRRLKDIAAEARDQIGPLRDRVRSQRSELRSALADVKASPTHNHRQGPRPSLSRTSGSKACVCSSTRATS
jgi:uncharacterized protein YbjT (DUF2867 family)